MRPAFQAGRFIDWYQDKVNENGAVLNSCYFRDQTANQKLS